jgi:hypothetical protein
LHLERVIVVHPASATLALWASEQMLRCSAFGAVLTWPTAVDDKAVRRLQLAAEAGGNMALLYRPLSAERLASPAAVRLVLHMEETLRIDIKKCRGGRADRSVHCALDALSNAA